MAKLNVTQFSSVVTASYAALPVAAGMISTGDVTFSTSTQSAAFDKGAKLVRLVSDTNCRITFGASPTATTSDIALRADMPEYFGVVPGQKLAVITDA